MFQYDPTFGSLIQFWFSPTMVGILVLMILFLLLGAFMKKFPKTKFGIAFELIYEKVYEFYSEILGDEAGKNIKMYIVALFFVILFANILSVGADFIAPIFGMDETGEFALAKHIALPTSDMQFNIALSLFSTLLLIYIQFGVLGFRKFLYAYFPIFGQNYIEIERGEMSSLVYYPVFILAKTGDIVISLFLGFLDLIGLVAKVISLAFRLFGNMISGTILLGMLIMGTTALSQALFGIDFPIAFPLIVYAQGILVAVIQAMVFPLLVAISIKMVMIEGE